MSWYYFQPRPSAAQRAANARKSLQKLAKKGFEIEPLGELSHRMKIATSFWGRAWCEHMESFSDYENRLPRGRTYVRSGSVQHLHIGHGSITSLVQGSSLYKQTIHITPLAQAAWKKIQGRCKGGIGSLIELLQGRISGEIMGVVTDRAHGLFPGPKEMRFECSCPDWADMCKHIAAVLYGVGARLDQRPELLFTLRGVDHNDLLATAADAGAAVAGRKGKRADGGKTRKRLDEGALGDVFGIDLAPAEAKAASPRPAKPKPRKPSARTRATSKPKPAAKKAVAGRKPKRRAKV